MRVLLVIGVLLLVLGIAALIIPVPQQVRHGFNAGPVSVGVTTTENERLNPAVGIVLIVGGVVLMVVGSLRK